MSDQYGNPIPPSGVNYPAPQQGVPDAYQVPSSMQGAQSAYRSAYTAQAQAPIDGVAQSGGRGVKREKHSGGGVKSFFAGLLGGIVAMALVGCLWSFTPLFNGMKSGDVVTQNGGTITINNTEDATVAQAVAAKDLDSVVTIYVYSNNSGWSDLFGSSNSSSSPNALGSGVIIQVDGNTNYVLTNYHVVQGISRATIKVGDDQYEASMVGYDEKTDLAVIKFTASGMKAIEWGDSDQLSVGEWVMAIGSPYGYEQTVTTGIVSALYRSDVIADSTGMGYSIYTDMIQTDAAINPGNSGGALVNAEGQLIGINTYISSTSQSSAGLGFAIPSNQAKRIAEQLMSGKQATHAHFGVLLGTSTDPAGVAITAVYKDTAADKAGFKTGDVITKFDGKTVTAPREVSIAVSGKNPGDTVSITYVRDGQENTIEVTLGSDETQTDEYAEGGEPAQQDNGFGGSGSGNGNSGNGFGFDNGGNSDGGQYYDLEDLFGEMFGGNGGMGGGF